MWIRIPENEAVIITASVGQAALAAVGLSDLVGRVMQEQETLSQPCHAELVQMARDLYTDSSCDVEVDDDAALSEGDEGAFVQMWGYVKYDKDEEA